jgi:O-antigen/teichoic acid export membrane protein
VSITPTEQPPSPALEPKVHARSADIDRSLVHGLAWTGSVNVATQVIRWTITLFIARILTPDDYGLVGMALVYIGLIQLVNEFGLSMAIVQQRELQGRMLARIAGLANLLGIGIFVLSASMAPLVARFFGEPAVRNIIVVAGLKFIIDGAGTVSRATLSRNLRYRALAAIDAVEAFVLAGATLVLALAGARYWALVIGSLIGSFAAAIVAVRLSPYAVAWPGRLKEIEHSLRFGRDVVISRIAWYGYQNADFAIVGRLLDKTALGFYTFAWNIASIPVEKVAAMVGRVTPGVFSAVQNDTAAMRRYFLSLTEALAFLTMPMSIGFVLVAPDFVATALGARWLPAVPVLQILAFYTGVRSISTLPSQVLSMRGRADLARRSSVYAAIVLPTCFIIGTHWGVTGVAMAWVIAYPVCIALWDYRYVFQSLELDVKRFASAVWPALSATIVMATVVLMLRLFVLQSAPSLIRLIVLTAVGVLAYGGTALALHGDRVRAFSAVAKTAFGSTGAA